MCVRLTTLPPSCAVVMKSGNFNFLEPSGPLQDCNGTALPIYRVSQEECEILRESVPYVKLYRYNPKHPYPKLNGYGDNGHRKVWAAVVSTNCKPSVTQYSSCSDLDERFLTR